MAAAREQICDVFEGKGGGKSAHTTDFGWQGVGHERVRYEREEKRWEREEVGERLRLFRFLLE